MLPPDEVLAELSGLARPVIQPLVALWSTLTEFAGPFQVTVRGSAVYLWLQDGSMHEVFVHHRPAVPKDGADGADWGPRPAHEAIVFNPPLYRDVVTPGRPTLRVFWCGSPTCAPPAGGAA
jgi:hypothetical protein